jgi:hypothetical protein
MFGVSINGQTGEVQIQWSLAPPWRVTCDMVETKKGRRVVGRLAIDAWGRPPEAGLTVDVLKSVRLSRAHAYADLNWPRPRPEPPARPSTDGRGRPSTLTPQFYRRVWERWNALVSTGHPHPAKALATEFKRSRTAMRSILQRIRSRMPEITGTREEKNDGKKTRKR